MPSFPLLFVLGLAVAGAPAPDNWPQFRGPTGDGHAAAADVPVKWGESQNVRWKTAIHDKGWSSPVIWGEQIWLTTARDDGKEMFAVCVDRRSGKVLHDVKVFDVEKPAFCHPFNSYASPTPVIEEGRVYVHFGSYGTACLDTTSAKVLWTRRDLHCDHWRGPGSSPILYGRLLILTFDGFDLQYVAALDKETGKTVWKTDRTIEYTTSNGDLKKAYATPTVIEVNGRAELVCPSAQATLAYEPETGKEIWRIVHGGMNVASRPVFDHGLLYLTTGHTAQLLAVRPEGSGDISRGSVRWQYKRSVPTRPSVLVVGDLLFMVNDTGIASCLEAKTGKLVWQERLGGRFSGSPIYAGGRIYAADEDGTTHVLEPGRKLQELAANKLDDGCMASPAVSGKSLFLRTKTHLYCIEQR